MMRNSCRGMMQVPGLFEMGGPFGVPSGFGLTSPYPEHEPRSETIKKRKPSSGSRRRAIDEDPVPAQSLREGAEGSVAVPSLLRSPSPGRWGVPLADEGARLPIDPSQFLDISVPPQQNFSGNQPTERVQSHPPNVSNMCPTSTFVRLMFSGGLC